MAHPSTKDIVSGLVPHGPCIAQGWVKTHRQSKSVSFLEINDGTSTKGLQIVVDPTLESYIPIVASLQTGASVIVHGNLVASPAKGQLVELQATQVELLGDAPDYPLQKKGHTLEFLRELGHLRLRSNTLGAVMRVRSEVSFAIHEFFKKEGFYYLHTPIISTSDCEGAGEMFRVSSLDMLNPPKADGKINYKEDFFGESAYLTVSGQLEGEIGATALSKIYTFGPTFRAENSNTTRHLAEFWMVEPEVAFADLEYNMTLAEDMSRYVIKAALERCSDELDFLYQREWADKEMLTVLESVANTSFVRMAYTDAVSALEKSGQKFEFPVKWGIDLQSEHERYVTDHVVNGPVIVTDYPKEIKSFYMRMNEDGKTVRAMDVLVPRLGEMIGGSQREERHDVLLGRIEECGLSAEQYWWYLELRKFGTVPHAGFGLGLERLLMYITGMQNIRDVIAFPRFPGSAKS